MKQNKGKLFDLYWPDALSQGSGEHEAALPVQVCNHCSWPWLQTAALSLFPPLERSHCSRADHRGVLGTRALTSTLPLALGKETSLSALFS